MSDVFEQTVYTVRKQVFKIFGGAFHIYDPDGNVAFYSKQKAFKLKEDIRVYTGEDMQTEVLTIQARQRIDFSAAYDVFDPVANETVGALRRRGFKSMLRDEWLFLDTSEREIGKIKEDSTTLALIRRVLTNIIPQTYHGSVDDQHVCTFKQHFNPFVMKVDLDFSPDLNKLLDRRLGIAAAVLLCAVEGRQGT